MDVEKTDFSSGGWIYMPFSPWHRDPSCFVCGQVVSPVGSFYLGECGKLLHVPCFRERVDEAYRDGWEWLFVATPRSHHFDKANGGRCFLCGLPIEDKSLAYKHTDGRVAHDLCVRSRRAANFIRSQGEVDDD